MEAKIAIIGAGIAGVTLAQELSNYAQVTIFEKARGLGGRMATRRHENFAFDHGAQYFTAHNQDFKDFLAPLIKNGVVASWDAQCVVLEVGSIQPLIRTQDYLVAVPSMNNLCKHLALNKQVVLNAEIFGVMHLPNGQWELTDKEQNLLGSYDWVISTAPAEQTQKLFKPYLDVQEDLAKAVSQPCFALMLGLNQRWSLPWDFALSNDESIKSIVINSSKPGRNNNVSSIVVQTHEHWSKKHLNLELENIKQELIERFKSLTAINVLAIDFAAIHLWRYALINSNSIANPYLNQDLKLAAIGDWSALSKIENIWQQAKQLSQAIKKIL